MLAERVFFAGLEVRATVDACNRQRRKRLPLRLRVERIEVESLPALGVEDEEGHAAAPWSSRLSCGVSVTAGSPSR
jgi:hypothetical protein